MLRVAVPNKGALSEPAIEILSEAGYRRRTESKDLTVLDPVNNVEFFFCGPKTLLSTSDPATWISGSPDVTWCASPMRRCANVWRLVSGLPASATPHPLDASGPPPTWLASESPQPTRTWYKRLGRQRD